MARVTATFIPHQLEIASMADHSPPDPCALLSLWNDIQPQRRIEYDTWHTLEHVPERVWVPGFIRGTRYILEQGAGPRYFSLYELATLDVLNGPTYRDLVERPTPWSASMRPSFFAFLRKTGPITSAAGNGAGGTLMVHRVVWPKGKAPADAACRSLATDLLNKTLSLGAMRIRLQRVLPTGPQAFVNDDQAPWGDEIIVLVDLYDGSRHSFISDALTVLFESSGSLPIWSWEARYRLAALIDHYEVAGMNRPAPRVELMPS